jgi:hypothetical protein
VDQKHSDHYLKISESTAKADDYSSAAI